MLRPFHQMARIVQMDPDDSTTFLFINGDLIRRDTTELDVPERGSLPFPSQELLSLLEQE